MLGFTKDASSRGYYWPDIAAILDGESEPERLREYIEAEIERRARKVATVATNHIVCTILGYSNPHLAMVAYAIAHGLGGLGEHSIREWAAIFGVSKQDLSKEVTVFRDVYDLEALGSLKTNQARNGYRKAQLERHKRKPKKEKDERFGFGEVYQ
jgi:hypothetical protein